jgi:hypothetical protein
VTGRHQPSGLTRGLSLLIDSDWSPEQAFAVIELLDDLREIIWTRYELALHDIHRSQRCTSYPDEPPWSGPPDEPF